ncbi:MAG: LysM peptidoglycan-binding domain-containing protein [Flammeovirgaceae bacterium]|nr:LysM peptidoglycan-binding domain-containing protein [Flammeovirgaceae bacterium]
MFRLLLFCFLFSITASFAQERSLDSLFAYKSFHVIQPKDNLYRIAKNHEVSLQQLKEINKLNQNLIHPGDTLFFEYQFPAILPQLSVISEEDEEFPLTKKDPEVMEEEPAIVEEIPHDQNLNSSLSSTGFLNENMLVMVCVLILAAFLLLFIIIISKKHKREEELTPMEKRMIMEQMNGNQPNP